MPTADAASIHADLTAEVAPQCERHFDTDAATHTVDGTDYTRVAWVVRPEVATALADLAESYADLTINPRPTPYAEVTYPPMPDTGERVEKGEVYEHTDGTPYLARQSHDRTADAPGDVPALFAAYRTGDDLEWEANGELLEVGDVRTYDGDEWIVRQEHQALEDREPDVYTAGWWRMKPVTEGDEVPEWAAQVSYAVGDHVTYDGTEYSCLQAHTSQVGWEPPNVPALWETV
ncbi:MAG: hypothetical protein U5L04_02715 [Trueperaceae bacterium]|nr:hypothetical protein [Trueperaceae bacterium]